MMLGWKASCLVPVFWFAVILYLVQAEDDDSSSRPTKCGIYLAPSTIPGSGLGMFVGDRSFKKGESVAPDGDIVIPIIERKWNTQLLSIEFDNFLWDEYGWYVFSHFARNGF